MSNPAHILIAHALETVPTATLSRQAELYRAIAAMAPRSDERKRYEQLAAGCDALITQHAQHEARHQQLVLDFKRGAL